MLKYIRLLVVVVACTAPRPHYYPMWSVVEKEGSEGAGKSVFKVNEPVELRLAVGRSANVFGAWEKGECTLYFDFTREGGEGVFIAAPPYFSMQEHRERNLDLVVVYKPTMVGRHTLWMYCTSAFGGDSRSVVIDVVA